MCDHEITEGIFKIRQIRGKKLAIEFFPNEAIKGPFLATMVTAGRVRIEYPKGTVRLNLAEVKGLQEILPIDSVVKIAPNGEKEILYPRIEE
jgi:hypothetical protein